MAKSKYEITLDFIRTPWVWGPILILVALGLGWINMDELERLADIAAKFFSSIFNKF